jgi:hypothetical protein
MEKTRLPLGVVPALEHEYRRESQEPGQNQGIPDNTDPCQTWG